MKTTKQFNKNDYFTAEVNDLTSQGSGVVKIDDYPFFVEGVIPGETVTFKVMKVGKKFGFGRLTEIVVESPDRVDLKDPIGGQIGTMTLQHMDYAAQLRYKKSVVENAFQRIGHFTDVTVKETLGMDHPWEYRNKAQIPVRAIQGRLETGFFRKNSHDLVPVENFHIQHPEIDRAVVVVRDVLREAGIMPYNESQNNGDVRHIIVKRGHNTGQMMVIIVCTKSQLKNESTIVEALVEQLPEVESFMLNVNSKQTNVILGRTNRVLWGKKYIEDKMLDMTFRISANSFYQVNTPQAEVLYKTAIEAADLDGSETVLDAYCGIGTLSLSLAKHAKHVYGMEITPEAVDMAEQNAKLNNLTNVTFELGKAEESLPKWNEAGIKFDVALVDPPRKGLDEAFIEALVEQAPERIVYVSCNPGTCARDCRILADAGYDVQWVQPVDMFGQTPHIESVTLLTKVNN